MATGAIQQGGRGNQSMGLNFDEAMAGGHHRNSRLVGWGLIVGFRFRKVFPRNYQDIIERDPAPRDFSSISFLKRNGHRL